MISAPLRVSAPKGAIGTFRFRRVSSSPSESNKIRCAAAPPAAAAAAVGRRASTLYEELGLRVGATGREIKAAYRRLARERHPDVAGEPAAADFVRLHDAYATLSDPDSRASYDRAAVMAMPVARHYPRWGAGGSGRPRRTWETDQCW
ncbi:chaperone protein dnaJ 11, chloroplastic-like [Phragmites australis]|uniref:chaperone protein dnaJ 11, chloroplastic-like n=1 Tax=Phragmites australis TaxID=29695 RepID=UPI002D77FAC1|nr:chaperone protein dnaJ 11, chloroplastic-like [Phragmites australis]